MNCYRLIGTAWAVLVLSATLVGDADACDSCGAPGVFACTCYLDVHTLPPAEGPADVASPPPSAEPSAAVPQFNSRPGAHAKLFLDFDGVDFGTTSWSGKRPGLRPAYDIDGDASLFSGQELANIEEIWMRVSEAFSMFNVNVTTVDPGNYNSRESAHVVISGDNSWWGGGGGVGFVRGFRNGGMVRATAWAFPDNLRGGDPKVVADASIHEAGHLFGLQHQSTYDDDGQKTDEYDDNDESPGRAPNMGVTYDAARGLWSIGADSSRATSVRNELAIMGSLSSTGNRFGFVPDEPGESFATAPQIDLSGEVFRGVIAQSDDVDYYKLVLDEPTSVSIQVDVAPYGPNLDAKLMLYGPDPIVPHLLIEDDPEYTTGRQGLVAGYTGTLSAGDYYVAVASHGGYTYDNGPGTRFLEDVGQYFLTASLAVAVPEPAAIWALLLMMGCCAAQRRRRV